MTISCVAWYRIKHDPSLTVRLASRYIIRSLRCLIGVGDSPEGAAELCEGLGEFTAPLEVAAFVGR